MPSEERGLLVEAARYAYDGQDVVRDVSLVLRPGEMAAVAGPNGSGKTTLLKLLSGIRKPRTGEVHIDGMQLAGLPAREVARKVAVMSQHLDPKLMFSVADIVAMGRTPYAPLLRPLGDHDRRAVRQALSFTNLDPLADRRFGELSGGEQQRVMLAMALAQETDYLLLDEPTVHLDLHHQYELLELLRSLREQREIGILAVMHDLNLASLYFERLVLMQQGRIVADGPTSHILAREDCLAVFQAPLSVVTHPHAGVPQVMLDRRT